MRARVARAVASRLLAVVCLAAAALLAGACSGVLGIEERTYDPTLDLSCDSYCSTVQTACTGVHALYASDEVCQRVCQKLPLGTLDDTAGNTIGCRLGKARLAASLGPDGIEENCPRAGPGGNGGCASDCDGYCDLILEVCPAVFADLGACLGACQAVPSVGSYSINVPEEDSIQCRLYHLTSATLDPVHCDHAAGVLKCKVPDGS